MRCCNNRNRRNAHAVGCITTSIGIGLFLAYIIPLQLLVCMLGMGLICMGVMSFLK